MLVHGRQDRARRRRRPTRRWRRRSSARSPRAAPRTRSTICATRSRTSAPPARRSPKPAKKLGLKPRDDRRRRPLRPRVPTASRSPDLPTAAERDRPPPSPATSASTTRRCRLPGGGFLCFDVNGITPSRERTLDEVKDKVEAQLARRRDRQAAARPRPTTWSTSSSPAARWPRSPAKPALPGAKGNRPAARQAGRVRCRRAGPGGLQHAERRTRQLPRADQADRALGVPRDRGRPIPSSIRIRRTARRSRHRCRIPTPTTSTANISRSSKAKSASTSTSRRSTRSLAAPAAVAEPMQIEPSADRLRRTLRPRRAAGGVDDAGRRSGDAGFRLPEDRRRQADELPAGVGGRRRGARALFDHRAGARPDLARQRHQRRGQSRGHAADRTPSRPAPSRRSRRCAR